MEQVDEFQAPGTRLAEVLERLRTQVRLNQRHLARLSGVSWTMIQLLERGHRAGKPVNPSPNTLRSLAHGIAINPLTNLPDQEREDEIYLELMQAAGYLDQPQAEALAQSPEGLGDAVSKAFPNKLGEAVARLLQEAPDLAPADQEFLARSIALHLNALRGDR